MTDRAAPAAGTASGLGNASPVGGGTLPAAMNPSPAQLPTGQSAAAPATATRSEVLEQVMRIVDDDLPVIAFLAAAPGSAQAASALGRLLAEHPVSLVDRCPVVSFTTGRSVDPAWRDWYPARPQSLWSLLEFYRGLYTPTDQAAPLVCPVDPLAELEALRDRAAADLR